MARFSHPVAAAWGMGLDSAAMIIEWVARLRNVEGLWRRATATRPGTMTEFIRARRLLSNDEIDAIIAGAPFDLIDFQHAAAAVPIDERPPLRDWIARFNAGVRRLAA